MQMKRNRSGNFKQLNKIFTSLEQEMKSVADDGKVLQMEKYLKNQFQFLGIPAPQKQLVYQRFREVYSPTTETELIQWVDMLWSQPYREYQHYAILTLEKHWKLIQSPDGATFIASLVLRNSWWDTVDMLASKILGKYYQTRIEELRQVLPAWISHEDMWMNRTAILVQLKYKEETHLDLLESAITPHLQSTEFFHQKAIGWSLREYAKTDPSWVRSFVQRHQLKPLSEREALKHISLDNSNKLSA
jgi:3-methyladenine DNA glycosylase AlkD